MGKPVRLTGGTRGRSRGSLGLQSVGSSRPLRESEIQASYFDWLKTIQVKFRGGYRPLRDFAFAVPNGIYVPGDSGRTARIIASMKRQGMKDGVSDIVIAFPFGMYHGAFLELKSESGKPTVAQSAWIELMESAGYYARIAFGFAGIQLATMTYLERIW